MRSGDTYRAAKRDARLRTWVRTSEFVPKMPAHHPHAKDVVAQLLRGWLMRRHGVMGARAAPIVQTGPSRHGKCLVATHLNIAKAKVIEARRLAKTGISCEPGQTHKDAAHRRLKHDAWMFRMRERYALGHFEDVVS